jgi:hypothetical protein
VVGGLVGSELGSRRIGTPTFRRLLGLVLLVAGANSYLGRVGTRTGFVGNMKWIAFVMGAFHTHDALRPVAPQAFRALRRTPSGRSQQIVVRKLGMLIYLMGAMLIYGAFNAAARPLVLMVRASAGAFTGFCLPPFRGSRPIAVAIDIQVLRLASLRNPVAASTDGTLRRHGTPYRLPIPPAARLYGTRCAVGALVSAASSICACIQHGRWSPVRMEAAPDCDDGLATADRDDRDAGPSQPGARRPATLPGVHDSRRLSRSRADGSEQAPRSALGARLVDPCCSSA